MIKRLFFLTVAAIACVQAQPSAMGQGREHNHDDPKLPAPIDDIIWWLPEDTQSILVARGPFRPKAIDPKQVFTPKPGEALGVEQAFQSLAVEPLLGPLLGIVDSLTNRTATLALDASRGLLRPEDAGQMAYRGCHILLLQDDPGRSASSMVQSLRRGATKVEQLGGQQVFMFEKERHESVWKIYLAHPEPNLFICATDRDTLGTVLDRRTHRAGTRALPDHLPEWRVLDVSAKCWGLRHYKRGAEPPEPLSPFTGGSTGVVDLDAVGLVYAFNPGTGQAVHIKYLSENKDAVALAKRVWTNPGQGLMPAVKGEGPNVVGISVPPQALENFGVLTMLRNMLMWEFGHVISPNIL